MPDPEPAATSSPMTAYREDLLAGHGRGWERGIEVTLFLCAFLAVVSTAGILLVLFWNALAFFQEVSVWEFLTGTVWNPIRGIFGVLPLVNGTLLIAIGSALLAVPIGLATAIYLSEFAPTRVRGILKPVLEMLAGIPSIVFGFFAILVLSPILQRWFDADVFNAANAIVVLSFMVLPIVTSLSEDALRSVPQELRHGALALGATKWEVAKQVVTPAALSGIFASILLGFSRAVGETMAVTIAGGLRPNTGANIFEPFMTMTSFMASKAQGDTVQAGPSYTSLFAVGLLLFVITFGFNIIADRVLARYREAY